MLSVSLEMVTIVPATPGSSETLVVGVRQAMLRPSMVRPGIVMVGPTCHLQS